MRVFYDGERRPYFYTGRRRAARSLPYAPIYTCPHGLVVCACNPLSSATQRIPTQYRPEVDR